MFKQCIICNKSFRTYKSDFKRRKCCSHKCSNIFKSNITKGKLKSEEHKRKISLAHLGKKRPPFSKEWKENLGKARKGRKFLLNHKKKIGRAQEGIKGNNWKGGRMKHSSEGYILIHKPDHPYPSRRRYILEHRFVMEQMIGRHLKPFEKVHHINGIKDDNRPKNLQLIAKQPHYGKIDCPFCNKTFLIR